MIEKIFDTLENGDFILSATLNNGPYELEVISLGATIRSLKVPNKDGIVEDVVLGYDSAKEYLENTTYYGMCVGRFANRIKDGAFEIDGVKYQLERNNGPNTLHSASCGFGFKNWDMELLDSKDPSVKLTIVSEDGEGNWPGNVEVSVVYTLTSNGRIEIEYSAKSDKKTLMNLTNHSYFNLSGDFTKKILDEEVYIDSDGYLEIDDQLIPTGKIVESKGTPFDFNEFHSIGERINDTNGGYDHCFCFPNSDGSLKYRAEIRDLDSKRVMKVYTTMPSAQMYTANSFEAGSCGKDNIEYTKNGGIAFETQYYPDSPNHSNFPSCVIEANKEYTYKTVYEFSVLK